MDIGKGCFSCNMSGIVSDPTQEDHPCPRCTEPKRVKAEVVLFKPSGKYYTTEHWRIPTKEDAMLSIKEAELLYGIQKEIVPDPSLISGDLIIPYSMIYSPDFRRIGGGAVLVVSQEPWGYPHLFPSRLTPAQQ